MPIPSEERTDQIHPIYTKKQMIEEKIYCCDGEETWCPYQQLCEGSLSGNAKSTCFIK
jgi:hypothetical protein